MTARGRAALAAAGLALLASPACRPAEDRPRPLGKPVQARPPEEPPTRGTPEALPLLRPHPLAAGLRLTIVPNLPGVATEDLPILSHRQVEVLDCDRRRLRLRWSGKIRLERADSARRREEWVRSRAHGGPEVVALPELAAEYDEKLVTGTLDFPDFTSARALVLPGLWPEGRATLKNSAAIWLGKDARKEIADKGEARVPFAPSSPLLVDPASSLLERAAHMAKTRFESDANEPPPERLKVLGYPERVKITVDGTEGEVQVFRASNWLGTFEVLADDANPLVVSFLPDPPSSRFLDLFAPAKILKTLLGYRVSAIDGPETP